MKKNEAVKKNTFLPPVMRVRKDEIDMILFLMCAVEQLKESQSVMEKRIKSIPNGWRDIRMITKVLDRLVDDIYDTLPEEKKDSLDAMLPDVRVKISYTRQVGRSKDDVSGIFTKDLDLLANVAHESVCRLCDKPCDRCELGKVYDRLLYTDRGKGESYTFNSIEAQSIVHGG